MTFGEDVGWIPVSERLKCEKKNIIETLLDNLVHTARKKAKMFFISNSYSPIKNLSKNKLKVTS